MAPQVSTDNAIRSYRDDKFGFKPYADILADVIESVEQLPLCIGIYGEWGSGKTSLMNLIQEKIASEKNKCIFFNPWKYDNKEELWHALIQSILVHIVKDQAVGRETAKHARELAKSAVWMMLKKGIETLSAGVVKGKDLERLKNAFSKQDEIHYHHINRFEKDFESVVDDYTGGGKLAIFIDDLDRCAPENAITVLESLKLFIGHAKCVFVIGMDQVVIEKGVQYKYGDKIEFDGRRYLEKIVQVPFYIPAIQFDKLKNALVESGASDYTDAIWELIRHGLGGNPRKTKRFVNCFFILRKILEVSDTDLTVSDSDSAFQVSLDGGSPATISEDDEFAYMATLLIFQLSFPEFYLLLRQYPSAWAECTDYVKSHREDDLFPIDGPDVKPSYLKPFYAAPRFVAFIEATIDLADQEVLFVPDASAVEQMLKAVSLVAPDGASKEFGGSYSEGAEQFAQQSAPGSYEKEDFSEKKKMK